MLALKFSRTKRLYTLAAIVTFVALAALPSSRMMAQGGSALYVALDGDDANDCRTAQTACRTIQAAIGKAAAGDTISVAAGTYSENLRIGVDMTIAGAGAGATVIDGAGSGVVLVGYSPQLQVGIAGVTIRGGSTTGAGGGIENYGRLTLTDTIVAGNSVGAGEGYQGLGGGIANFGTLSIDRSAVVDNSGYTGGGIWSGGALAITNSTISGNRARVDGGGVAVGFGTTAAANASFNGVTVAHNVADSDADGTGTGGAVAVTDNGSLELVNSLLAANRLGASQPNDCSGALGSLGHNLLQTAAGCTLVGEQAGNVVGQDPRLAPLAANDGDTPIHALLAGSPALDAASAEACLATDQRGVERPQGSACDIGAFEASAEPACPCSLWDDDARPEVLVDPDRNAVELGVRFRASIDGFVLGVRYYKSKDNVGTHVGNLWAADGSLLASATFVCETEAGWQEARFAEPVPIRAGQVYTVSYHAPYGSYAVTEDYFTASGRENGPLYALHDREGGGNGVYTYGASAFPASTYRASNYWVDVVFVVENY